MLFSEIYSSYYNVVAAVLAEAVEGKLTGMRLNQIIQEKAFAESVLTIPTALQGRWPLLKPDGTTPIRHVPTMPLTAVQKQWLKTLLQDPRIALFDPNPAGLEDIEPLFDLSDIVYFDQYADGDPYGDPDYIQTFRCILTAIREHRQVRLRYLDRGGAHHSATCVPYRLEYSAKDDKFRVLAMGRRSGYTINMARIGSCVLLEPVDPAGIKESRTKGKTLTFELTDQRNALDRVLLHFSHFEKETVRLDERTYRVTLRYDRDDETELLIRVLSFGPMLRVIAPDNFIEQVRQRLRRQQSCGL